ncbi:hypothetical protein J437_LFUL006233 [Ladona fulva]|uniref:Bromo domain-containing protein n=1 Tax=Ladona fulva TaxID=123851 RepID=A0A8K0K5T6_LADFU|nr:hypothetical protein J437_LFUL006233 [Ladona fulva]
MRRMKRSMTECLISSEDSCSIPDDGGFWPNVMSIKGEKADDTESVTSSIYKRRRVQRKSTNSDPDSLSEAPSFMFSPNSASLEESDYQAWKRLVLHTWDQLADHRYATIFMTPVRTDEAPRYYHVVYRPMDLGSIRKNVEKGVVRSISHFQRDILLMFTNALMYNPSHHDVHLKTAVMQKECLQYLQVLVQESAEDPEVFRHEIRESNNKIHSTGLDDVVFAPKSDSLSSEDQLSCSLMTGEASSTPQHNITADGMG